MTIDELIELAQDAREDLGGDAQVRVACQPCYPLRAALCWVTVPPSTDPSDLYGPDETAAGQKNDGTFLWLATGNLPDGENPYAPDWPGPAPASPQRGNRDEQRRKAPGFPPPHRSWVVGAGRRPARRPRQGRLHQPG
jgi:hypothetical protein